MTHKHHSVLVVESEARLKRLLLPGIDTGLGLYRHCASEYPSLPFLMTASREFPMELSPPVLNPEDPGEGLPLIERMLDQKSVREHKIHEERHRSVWAMVLTLAGLFAMAPNFEASVKAILQNPPFTDRFIILPVSPQNFPEEKILTPPPPGKPEATFDIRVVFGPRLKADMERILTRADEIIALASR